MAVSAVFVFVIIVIVAATVAAVVQCLVVFCARHPSSLSPCHCEVLLLLLSSIDQ